MRRASMADDDLWSGDALMPRLRATELQPGRAQRVKLGVFGHTGEPVHARGLINDRKRSVTDQPVHILTRHPKTPGLPSGDHAPLLAGHQADPGQRSTSGHGAIVSILRRTLHTEPRIARAVTHNARGPSPHQRALAASRRRSAWIRRP